MKPIVGCRDRTDHGAAVLDFPSIRITDLEIDDALVRALGRMDIGVVATAPGEDPVNGSVHGMLAPDWGRRRDRSTLTARQISRRGGDPGGAVKRDRVELTGQAVTFLEGTMRLTSS